MRYLKILGISLVLFTGIFAITFENDRLFEIAKNMELYSSVYKMINTHYVDEIDPNTLMKTGIDAMVSSLDPYTNYITESQVQSYRISDDEKFQGIGTSVYKIENKFYLSNVLEGGAAQEAGLKAGDEILLLNGTALTDKSENDVMSLLRGAPGTNVGLVIKVNETGKEINLTLKRDEVKISNVPHSDIVADGVGYIQLTTFTENASANISKAYKNLKDKDENLKGLMIDLRQNGGGLLREAVNICNLYIPRGKEVVTTKGKLRDKDNVFRTMMTPEDLDIPLVVLVDGRSASASEIVSGVLQDYDRAVILGQRTYGKGLVQNFFEVGYNSRVKVTISKYYIPSGRCIQGVEYANGDPVDIPDSKRSKFKTKNGRTVLDGGGVTPDVKIEKPVLSNLMKALGDQKMVFLYVNEYMKKHPNYEGEITTFNFMDYSDFVSFLEKKKFTYQLDGEDHYQNMVASLDKSASLKADLSTSLKNIGDRFKNEKMEDMKVHKLDIVHEIEKEIASRYRFEKGKSQISLRNDNEVKEAIGLFNDKTKYNALLSVK
jgi:carboxyl-terminal processing protease